MNLDILYENCRSGRIFFPSINSLDQEHRIGLNN
jgi:hypothetical protein